MFAQHGPHAFSHKPQVTVQIHRFIGLMREIAVLLSFKDIELCQKTRLELGVRGIDLVEDEMLTDQVGLPPSSEPLNSLFSAGLCWPDEYLLDEPHVRVGIGWGPLCLGLKPLRGPPETLRQSHAFISDCHGVGQTSS